MNIQSVMDRVRAQSVPVKTTPVGWSDKTVKILAILKKYNPYTTLSEQDKSELDCLRKMPELSEYLPWFVCGPGHKEIYANQLVTELHVPDYNKHG